MKSENKDKLFLAGTVILMLAVLIVLILAIKEMPETTAFPMYNMSYPIGPF